MSAFLAEYGHGRSLSLEVETMIALAAQMRPVLDGSGHSLHHVHLLHHYPSCLVWNGRYTQARQICRDLAAMADRLGGAHALAYALIAELLVSC